MPKYLIRLDGAVEVDAANEDEAYALAGQIIDDDPSFVELCDVEKIDE
ncbi:hypothetical protein [Fodinicola feengrottensis]|uniref:Uncharacterized protein n=1 Tax=Fodinicola feengrottensis TaxID=435914 RepID=A0ABN2IAF1_9ACTN|nr:hypothetical protein [Fodinicola feengrottensis]